uniref:Secreted protein n=1 Tax=Triticum urartu TaxID=4572 RepID=A0A8R7P9H8_TRIUA
MPKRGSLVTWPPFGISLRTFCLVSASSSVSSSHRRTPSPAIVLLVACLPESNGFPRYSRCFYVLLGGWTAWVCWC